MKGASLCAVFLSILALAGPAGAADVSFEARPDVAGKFVLDIRRAELCEASSLAGARCLPAAEVLAPNRRLPNVSGLLWLLGAVGLTGREHVVIVGDDAGDKAFMAGLLFVAGQSRVTIATAGISELNPQGGGTSRSKTREQVFQAPMRDDNVILRNELSARIAANSPVTILDVRSEAEYWGTVIRSARGGHVPGAVLLAGNDLLPAGARAIVYGHDSVDGLAALARLTAQGIEASVLLDGWSGWAADGSLPADAVAYPQSGQRPAGKAAMPAVEVGPRRLAVVAVLIIAAFAVGYFVRWLSAGKQG